MRGIFAKPIANLLQSVVPTPQMQVAWFHVCFNVLNTFILLPFIKYFVKFAEMVIKDKKPKETRKLKYVDDLLLKTPPVALMQAKKRN